MIEAIIYGVLIAWIVICLATAALILKKRERAASTSWSRTKSSAGSATDAPASRPMSDTRGRVVDVT